MHTFLTGFKIEEIDNGLRLELNSPGGDYVFDIRKVLATMLVDELIETLYGWITGYDNHQLELFEGENNGI